MLTTPTRRSRLAFLEVTGAMAVAGSSVVPATIAQDHLPVFAAAFLSFLFALVVTLPLQLARLKELRELLPRELLLMLLQALFGMVLFRLFLLYGLRSTSAVNAGIIMGCGPAVTIFLGAVVFRERLGGRRIAALVLSVGGIIAIRLAGAGSQAGGSSHSLFGDLLVLFAVASESLLTIFRKLSVRRISSVTNTTVLSFSSAIMTLPFAAGSLLHPAALDLGPSVWLALAYYGSFVTVVGYLLWGDGAMHLPAGRVGIATGAMPLTSALLSTLLLGESFGWGRAAGCMLVLTSIVVSAGR